jgi:hypothetical protein
MNCYFETFAGPLWQIGLVQLSDKSGVTSFCVVCVAFALARFRYALLYSEYYSKFI